MDGTEDIKQWRATSVSGQPVSSRSPADFGSDVRTRRQLQPDEASVGVVLNATPTVVNLMLTQLPLTVSDAWVAGPRVSLEKK